VLIPLTTQTTPMVLQMAESTSWLDLAVFSVAVVSAVFAGVLGGVAIYFTVSFGTRRETRREIRRIRDELGADISRIAATDRRADMDALIAVQESALHSCRNALAGVEMALGGKPGATRIHEATLSLEHEIRRLKLLRREGQRATLWWLAEHGDTTDLTLLEEYLADASGEDDELRSLARSAIRRIRSRADSGVA